MSQSHRNYFNGLAPEWDSMMNHSDELSRLIQPFQIEPDDWILDTGCGTGRLSRALLPMLGEAGRIVAQDIAEYMLITGEKTLKSEKIDWLCSHAAYTGIKNSSFDKIICFSAFPHFEHKENVLNEYYRILKPRGRLLILHTESSDSLNQFHAGLPEPVCNDILPSVSETETLFRSAGFSPLKCIEKDGLYWAEARK